MKLLITGANGYIGSHVVKYITDTKTCDLIAVDFSNSKLPKNIEYKNIDIIQHAQDDNLYEALGKPDAVLHMAWKDGFAHNSDAHLMYLNNHYHFLKNMIDSGCKNISVMGTMHEVGYFTGEINENTPCNPMSLYGIAKNALRQSLLAYSSDQDVAIKWLRAFYITGDDSASRSVFSKILEMDKNGQKTFPFVTGTNQYDFISVQKLAEYITRASVQTSVNGIINVCSGQAIALKDKVEQFIKENRLHITPDFGAFPSRKYDSPLIYGNIDKLNKILGKDR